MMPQTKKNILIGKIVKEIAPLDIAWYLRDEVKDFLKYLHFYKLKNILQNIDALKEYLLLLDKQSTNQIYELEYEHVDEFDKGEHDILYYLSQNWLDLVGEHKIYQKLWENDYNLHNLMQGIKWFLLLTADEFCNASATRMSINRMVWEKELK